MAIVRNITERKKIWKENERIRYLLNQRIKELTTLLPGRADPAGPQ